MVDLQAPHEHEEAVHDTLRQRVGLGHDDGHGQAVARRRGPAHAPQDAPHRAAHEHAHVRHDEHERVERIHARQLHSLVRRIHLVRILLVIGGGSGGCSRGCTRRGMRGVISRARIATIIIIMITAVVVVLVR